jgi:hypothetical protein
MKITIIQIWMQQMESDQGGKMTHHAQINITNSDSYDKRRSTLVEAHDTCQSSQTEDLRGKT